MNIVSFNVNGLRARLHQLEAVIQQYSPDIIGLQETKVADEEFPEQQIHDLGYEVTYHGQKGHYGVALLYRLPLVNSRKGFFDDTNDTQKRLISATFDTKHGHLTVINGYFPQGENRDHPQKYPNKAWFYRKTLELLESDASADEHILLMGDMNVAPDDKDIGIGDSNKKRWLRTGKCCFLPEEREWFAALQQWGLVDSFRHFHPDKDNRFSWFDYRSRGFEQEPRRGLRIDFILASQSILNSATAAGIYYDIRAMDKPSDHCPIWLTLTE